MFVAKWLQYFSQFLFGWFIFQAYIATVNMVNTFFFHSFQALRANFELSKGIAFKTMTCSEIYFHTCSIDHVFFESLHLLQTYCCCRYTCKSRVLALEYFGRHCRVYKITIEPISEVFTLPPLTDAYHNNIDRSKHLFLCMVFKTL